MSLNKAILYLVVTLGVLHSLFYLFIYGTISAGTMVISTTFGLIYTVLLATAVRFIPGWPKGVAWMVTAFLWGAGAAVAIALLFAPTGDLPQQVGWDAASASFGGAYPEEFAKGIGIFAVLQAFPQLRRPWHGAAVGFVVGMGFEVYENIQYGIIGGFADPNTDLTGIVDTWESRLLFGLFLHGVLCVFTGWGLGWALFAANWSGRRRFFFALRWFAVAFVCHFFWNYQVDNHTLFFVQLGIVSVVMYGLVAWIIWQARQAARADNGYAISPAGPVTRISSAYQYSSSTGSIAPSE